jgi:hypothetical protein
MLAEPDKSRSPEEVFATVQSWLEQLPATPGRAGSPERPGTPSAELQFDTFTERPFTASAAAGRLVGISAVPQGDPAPLTAVFLNAGAVRRIGPHRLWVDTARRWAVRGIPSLRLDLGGIGDSDGDSESLANVAEFYEPRYTDQVRAALDQLEQERLGERFVVVGLCSGSSWAFHAALADRRVEAAFMINPRILYWDEALDAARDLRRTRLLVKPVIWKRILRGDVSPGRVAAFLGWSAKAPLRAVTRRRTDRSQQSPTVELVAQAFDRLKADGAELRFFFCDGEPLRDEMTRDGLLSQHARWPNVAVSFLPGRDHTLRPLWMQQYVDAALDAALDGILAGS